jgi:U32 family peptidase
MKLLSPAGDWISLRAAVKAGCDAVYFGIKEFNMRANAKNFSLGELGKIVEFCHSNNIKAYLTLNSIVYDDEIKNLVKVISKAKVDAIICWDYAVLNECVKLRIPIHLSTQASISNYNALKLYKKKFPLIKSVNLARELSLEQIKKIIKQIKKDKLGVEIETFIHGAMCVSVSGRCFLSQEVFGRSANRGDCIQPCRRKYDVKDMEEKHSFSLGEDHVMSPKDLCTIEIIDKLIKAGINVGKIEGRNRSPEYVKVVTESYREAIDNKKYDKKQLKNKLKTVYNRGFSTGFYMGKPINEWSKVYGSKATTKKQYIGKVLNYFKKVGAAEILLEAGSLKLGDKVMVQGNTTGIVEDDVKEMQINKKRINNAKKGEMIALKIKKLRKKDKVYKIINV